jgi:hypothetical protein
VRFPGTKAKFLLFGVMLAVLAIVVSLILVQHRSAVVTSRATQGQLTLAASPDRVGAGEVVQITLIIRGPARVISSCQVPNPEIWAVSPSNRRIPLTHASLCQSGTEADVVEGESVTESVYWATSSDLAPGVYSIHGKLSGFPVPLFSHENLPVIAVRIVQ